MRWYRPAMTKTRTVAALALAVALLSGCASTTGGPGTGVTTVPGPTTTLTKLSTEDTKGRPFWLTVDKGQITKIEEQFIP